MIRALLLVLIFTLYESQAVSEENDQVYNCEIRYPQWTTRWLIVPNESDKNVYQYVISNENEFTYPAKFSRNNITWESKRKKGSKTFRSVYKIDKKKLTIQVSKYFNWERTSNNSGTCSIE